MDVSLYKVLLYFEDFIFYLNFVFSFSTFAAFNLIEGIDAAAIEAKIAKYQEENAEQIMINRARKVLLTMVFLLVQSLPYMAPNKFMWFA